MLVEDSIGTTIKRKSCNSWDEYFNFISEAKVLLITTQEDTFGYQAVDAVINHCIPIAPSNFSYPELLPPEFMYSGRDELISKLDYIINSDVQIPNVPELLCHGNMVDFYRNILKTMTED
jgi:hypothetical protein